MWPLLALTFFSVSRRTQTPSGLSQNLGPLLLPAPPQLFARPPFFRWLSLGNEEELLHWLGDGIQQKDGARLVKPGKVIEIAFLLVLREFLVRRRPQHQHISLDAFRQTLPPCAVLRQRFLLDGKQRDGA